MFSSICTVIFVKSRSHEWPNDGKLNGWGRSDEGDVVGERRKKCEGERPSVSRPGSSGGR